MEPMFKKRTKPHIATVCHCKKIKKDDCLIKNNKMIVTEICCEGLKRVLYSHLRSAMRKSRSHDKNSQCMSDATMP